jgi:hypothetical protein
VFRAAPARRALNATLAGIERVMPSDAASEAFLREERPDVLLVTPLVMIGSPQIEIVRAARRLGIPTALAVGSWDHLSSKSLVREIPDRVLVWNRWLRRGLLFVGAAAIAGFSIRRGIDPFDEGLALQAASRIVDGQLPYSDFRWAYGPGQPFLTAGLFELFGPSLIVWRIVRALIDAAVATLVYSLVRRRAPEWLALVAWLTTACAMAQPLSANPFPLALLFGLAAVAVALADPLTTRRALAAGALCGLAAAWRLDFGLYAGLAVVVAVLARPGTGRDRLTRVAWSAGAAIAVGLVAYVPFLIAAGPSVLWDELVGFSLRDRDYWTLPFPWSYDGDFRAWPPGDLLEDAKDVLGFYVPLMLALGGAIGVASAAFAWRRERRIPWRWLTMLGFAAGGWLYLSSRTDEFHETPLIVMLSVLLAWVIAWARRERIATLGAAAGLVLALLLAATASNRLVALLRPPDLEPLDLAIADGVRVEPDEAESLPRVVRLVQAEVPPGEPIYVAPRRSDLARIGNPLFYVLADRPNALEADFPLFARREDHEQVVADLSAAPPRIVVRWTDPESSIAEDNLRGEVSSYRGLDELLESDYERVASIGYYEVLAHDPDG